jgi:hypothetical protein
MGEATNGQQRDRMNRIIPETNFLQKFSLVKKQKITKRTHFSFYIAICPSTSYVKLRQFKSGKRTHFSRNEAVALGSAAASRLLFGAPRAEHRWRGNRPNGGPVSSARVSREARAFPFPTPSSPLLALRPVA